MFCFCLSDAIFVLVALFRNQQLVALERHRFALDVSSNRTLEQHHTKSLVPKSIKVQ
jgi:hypothetical protein